MQAEIERVLDAYGYPCQNDASKNCPEFCPFRSHTHDIYASGLQSTNKSVRDLEGMLRGRNEALQQLSQSENGKATLADVATSAAIQVHEMIVRKEIREGKRRPCAAYPDVALVRRPRKRT